MSAIVSAFKSGIGMPIQYFVRFFYTVKTCLFESRVIKSGPTVIRCRYGFSRKFLSGY